MKICELKIGERFTFSADRKNPIIYRFNGCRTGNNTSKATFTKAYGCQVYYCDKNIEVTPYIEKSK